MTLYSLECADVSLRIYPLSLSRGGWLVAGTFRNDLFVTLLTAELDRDMKKTLKNLEVRLVVADSLGFELKVCYSVW